MPPSLASAPALAAATASSSSSFSASRASRSRTPASTSSPSILRHLASRRRDDGEASSRRRRARGAPPTAPRALENPFAPPDLSGDLLARIAEFALSTNLRAFDDVTAVVDASVFGMLGGRVDGVIITGARWASRKNLTCATARFEVGAAAIDPIALVTERVVKLREPARGTAKLVFTTADFGNFLSHPLTVAAMRSHAWPSTRAPGGFELVGERVALEDGAVVFEGRAVEGGGGREGGGGYRIAMRPKRAGDVGVVVECHRYDDDGSRARHPDLDAAVETFFETLMIDLCGAQLRFRQLAIDERVAEVRLELALTVVAFPPPNASF